MDRHKRARATMGGDREGAVSPALVDYLGAQRYLGGISRSTLKRLISDGSLRSVLIGVGRRMIPVAALDEYIEAQTTPSKGVA